MGKYFYLFLFILGFTSTNVSANCPGCVVELPLGMAEDTIFLGDAPNGMAGVAYDEDVSFRMPMTTDPVNENDPDVPAGLTISAIELIGISNVPPGLSWEANATSFDPQSETDGCIKFCGTPLAPGLYVIQVTVEATVFVLTQEVTFPIEILIEPSNSINDGFSLTNGTGCGSVTVDFQNNVPSGGNPGYSYLWDFGNGNSTLDENPSSQTYTQPGTYIVNYQATIDTSGYILTRVGVNEVSCFDIPTFPDFSNNPDLHVEITDPNGVVIFESETVSNTDPPIEAFPNITLGAGQYQLRVIDSDSGINGADDICGEITFNQLSNGLFTSSDFELELEIFHPVETILSSDTVIVYGIPDQPSIVNSGSDEFCAGETVTLTSSYSENNQWYFEGAPIAGENGESLEVFESGIYQVVYTSSDGCSAMSDGQLITINENPEIPTYNNSNNLLSLLETISFDGDYSLQWLQDGTSIEGETSTSYCAMEDGVYTLEVTDNTTGCISIYTETIDHDENLSCFTSADELTQVFDLNIYPNPATDWINITLNTELSTKVTIQFYDMTGRLYSDKGWSGSVDGATILAPISVQNLVPGMYFIELQFDDQRLTRKFVKR